MRDMEHTLMSKEELDHILKKDEIFYTKSWREAVIRGTQSENFAVLTSFRGENALLGIYFKKEESVFKLVGSPLPGIFTPYLDPVWLMDLTEKEKKEVFSSHARFLKKSGFSYIEYRFFDYEEAKLLNEGINFSLNKFYNYILKVDKQIESKISDFCKKALVRAKRSGVLIERIEADIVDVEDYYFMLEAISREKGKKVIHSFDFFKEIVHKMQGDNKLFFIRAVLDNKIISMMIFLYDAKKMVWLSGVTVDSAKEIGVEHAMILEAFKFAYGKRLEFLDLNRKGDKELDKLKEDFGASLHACGELSYKTPLAKSAEALYKKLKRLS